MKTSNNKGLVLLATLGILGVIAAGGTIALQQLRSATKPVTYVDESKLYLGIPKAQDGMPVTLSLTATTANGTDTKEYSSSALVAMDGQDSGIVFLDYASNPLFDLGSQEIGYWLADKQNTLVVTTTAKEVITSSPVDIDDSGIWFINVAKESGATPETKHADYISQK
jgi:hypothetical protein